MKSKIILTALCFTLIALPKASRAQLNLSSWSNALSSAKTSSYNSLLNSLSTFITPSSYTAGWQSIKASWAAKLKNAKDIATYKSLLTDWVNNIKPSAFNASWLTDKAGWMSKLQSATKLADIASLTSKLETSLNASAFSSNFASAKGYIDKGLNLLKQ